jgi:hypothetical protein
MKTISIWANKNQKLAITFIVIIELLKGVFGAAIGNDFLPSFSNATIEIWVLAIVFFVSFVQINFEIEAPFLNKIAHRKLRLRSTGIIFLSTFFLSILLGNHFKNSGYSIDNQLVSYAGVTIKIDSTQQVGTSTFFEKVIKAKQFSQNNKPLFSKKTTDDGTNNTGKRVGFALLFLLSLVLTVLGIYLSCGIACSGYGFWAVLVLLLTLGVHLFGIYFLMRTFSKVMKPWREMTPKERRKEIGKTIATWGVFNLVSVLFSAISNLFNRQL